MECPLLWLQHARQDSPRSLSLCPASLQTLSISALGSKKSNPYQLCQLQRTRSATDLRTFIPGLHDFEHVFCSFVKSKSHNFVDLIINRNRCFQLPFEFCPCIFIDTGRVESTGRRTVCHGCGANLGFDGLVKIRQSRKNCLKFRPHWLSTGSMP